MGASRRVAVGALNRCAATSATSATSAIEATIHGSAVFPRSVGAAMVPTGVPQWWQKRAPGVSDEAHERHVAPSTGAPQLAQKRPSARAPQDGHVVMVGAGIRCKVLEVLKVVEVLEVRLALEEPALRFGSISALP